MDYVERRGYETVLRVITDSVKSIVKPAVRGGLDSITERGQTSPPPSPPSLLFRVEWAANLETRGPLIKLDSPV